MHTSVIIDGLLLSEEEVALLNDETANQGIEFLAPNSKNFLPPDVIAFLINLPVNLGYGAAYDILKFILAKIFTLLTGKPKNKSTKIVLNLNKKKYSFTANFPLTESQKDVIIEAAAQKLLIQR